MTRRHYFWLLFLLFHHSCNFFSRETATYEHKDWGADIAINADGVQCTGTINGSPVLRLRGKIAKNVPGIADPILGAVFMAQDQELKALASIIQKHDVKPQGASGGGPVMNVLIPLAGGHFVTYERIERREQGSVKFDVSSLNPQKGLKSATAYDTTLFIKIGPHVFYTADKVRYTTPDQEDVAKVEMQSAECRHTYDTDGLKMKFEMHAKISQWNSESKAANAGFLLIEEGKGPFSQVEVVERHLGNGGNDSIFPSAPNQFVERDGVIVCLANGSFQGAETFSITDIEAGQELLKKGKTYHVFGVVEQEDGL